MTTETQNATETIEAQIFRTLQTFDAQKAAAEVEKKKSADIEKMVKDAINDLPGTYMTLAAHEGQLQTIKTLQEVRTKASTSYSAAIELGRTTVEELKTFLKGTSIRLELPDGRLICRLNSCLYITTVETYKRNGEKFTDADVCHF